MKSKSILFRLITAAFTVAVLLIATLTFQVQQYESAVVTRFGAPVDTIVEPGIYFKYPWPISAVHKLDKRLDVFEMRISEALTKDQRNVVLPIFVAWKIENPRLYLEALGGTAIARDRLDGIISSAKNSVLGQYNFSELVSRDPAKIKLDQLQQQTLDAVKEPLLRDYGIDIVAIGVQRIALPEPNTFAVFERMRAERAKVASGIRAEGRQRADEIRAEADATRTITLAEANRDAAELIGEGESKAARIYREAYSQDEELYRFLRELEALENVTRNQTRIYTDTTQAPFNLLKLKDTERDSDR